MTRVNAKVFETSKPENPWVARYVLSIETSHKV